MKYIAGAFICCVVYDIVNLLYHVGAGADVFSPGLYIVLLVMLSLYFVGSGFLIRRKGWADSRITLTVLLLSPVMVYFILHVIVVVVLLGALVKGRN